MLQLLEGRIYRSKGVKPGKVRQVERSRALRRLTFAAQAVSFTAAAYVTQLFWLLPIALALLAAGHVYAFRYHAQDRRIPAVRMATFIALHLALGYLLIGIFAGVAYPQAQFAMLATAIVSFELYSRLNLFSGLGMGMLNLYVAATLSRDLVFGAFLVAFIGLCLAFMWVADSEDGVASSTAVLRNAPKPSTRSTGWVGRAAQFGALFAVIAPLIFIFTPRFAGRPLFMPISIQVPIRAQPSSQIINPAVPLLQLEGVTQPEGSSDYYYGFANTLDLSYRGGLSDTLMMYVSSPAWSYWRGYAYDTFDGVRWTQSDSTLRTETSRARGSFLIEPRPTRETFVQSFYIAQDMPNILWTGGSPTEVFFAASEIALDDTGGIRVGEPLRRGMVYSVISQVQTHDPERLRESNYDLFKLVPGTFSRYVQTPSTTTERTRALAEQITADSPTVYDKVTAIRDYLIATYPYDFYPPPQAINTDAVDQFLFVDQRGVCEHFVSAMIVLLRALNIPSRFVVGYGSGTYNPFTNFYEVRASDAHAWVEVYFPNDGWIAFDPTPGWVSDPQTRGMDRWLFSDAFAGLELPSLPLGEIASAGGAILGALALPLIAVSSLFMLIVGGRAAMRWLRLRRAKRPRALSDPARRLIFAQYRRAERRLRRAERRSPAQTVQQHAVLHTHNQPALGALADLVDVAAYRPQPPEPGLQQWARRLIRRKRSAYADDG